MGALNDAIRQESLAPAGAEERLIALMQLEVAERSAAFLEENRRMVALFESLPGLFLVLDPGFVIVAVTDAYLKATLTQREKIIGKGIFEVFPDNPEEIGATGVSNLRTSLERVRQHLVADTMAIQRYDIRGADGVWEEHYWSPINSPVFGPDRKLFRIVHRVEEVTDFVKSRREMAASTEEMKIRLSQTEGELFQGAMRIQLANKELEAANKQLEAFSYSVSHDLRAPLRAVYGYAQLLVEDYGPDLPDPARRFLESIQLSAKKMGTLIDDLLAFSRLSRVELRTAPVDNRTLVHEVLHEVGYPWTDRTVNLRIGDLPNNVGDASLIKQVWMNLLSNAVKYTGKKPVAEIVVDSRKIDGKTAFYVQDNGTGFDMKYAGKLFGVFERLHVEEDFPGTGVGLAIAHRIVERHGGRIWAESQEGEGATFFFTIPA